MSLLHHFEDLALTSTVMNETIESSLFVLSIRKSKFVEKLEKVGKFDLANGRDRKHFSFSKRISATKNCAGYRDRLF